ncbi:hypothetical protein TNIN_91341 [Trichonephila inaurata madagascariensis]|uniref:Uncharacterized protein n=1 Tax=Trichonephila inaurata madagascariensis TaxID=2747483 RepID=A0A8X6WXQ8_9ARAC|nr:hypothetical protein TNIN_91341 [Trichonephila inaurata madagascariensis]
MTKRKRLCCSGTFVTHGKRPVRKQTKPFTFLLAKEFRDDFSRFMCLLSKTIEIDGFPSELELRTQLISLALDSLSSLGSDPSLLKDLQSGEKFTTKMTLSSATFSAILGPV